MGPQRPLRGALRAAAGGPRGEAAEKAALSRVHTRTPPWRYIRYVRRYPLQLTRDVDAARSVAALYALAAHQGALTALCHTGDAIATGGSDGTVQLWRPHAAPPFLCRDDAATELYSRQLAAGGVAAPNEEAVEARPSPPERRAAWGDKGGAAAPAAVAARAKAAAAPPPGKVPPPASGQGRAPVRHGAVPAAPKAAPASAPKRVGRGIRSIGLVTAAAEGGTYGGDGGGRAAPRLVVGTQRCSIRFVGGARGGQEVVSGHFDETTGVASHPLDGTLWASCGTDRQLLLWHQESAVPLQVPASTLGTALGARRSLPPLGGSVAPLA